MEEKSVGRSFLILSLAGILVKILSAAYVPLLNAIIGQDGIGIYNPSNVESNLDTAEAFLKAYISMMKDSKVIVPNNHY